MVWAVMAEAMAVAALAAMVVKTVVAGLAALRVAAAMGVV